MYAYVRRMYIFTIEKFLPFRIDDYWLYLRDYFILNNNSGHWCQSFIEIWWRLLWIFSKSPDKSFDKMRNREGRHVYCRSYLESAYPACRWCDHMAPWLCCAAQTWLQTRHCRPPWAPDQHKHIMEIPDPFEIDVD